jgi:hypothetical protein
VNARRCIHGSALAQLRSCGPAFARPFVPTSPRSPPASSLQKLARAFHEPIKGPFSFSCLGLYVSPLGPYLFEGFMPDEQLCVSEELFDHVGLSCGIRRGPEEKRNEPDLSFGIVQEVEDPLLLLLPSRGVNDWRPHGVLNGCGRLERARRESTSDLDPAIVQLLSAVLSAANE